MSIENKILLEQHAIIEEAMREQIRSEPTKLRRALFEAMDAVSVMSLTHEQKKEIVYNYILIAGFGLEPPSAPSRHEVVISDKEYDVLVDKDGNYTYVKNR